MRTETVENTNSLRENTETEIVITDIRNMSNKYHKSHEKVSSHQFTKYHQNAMIKADEFLKSFESLDQRVENQLSDCKLQIIERNRHIIKYVAEAILSYGRQCIALRRDNKDLAQNKIIDIIGSDIILIDIVEENINAKFCSALADEVLSHNKEELANCLKFVDNDKNIREVFVGFLPLKRRTGFYIVEPIMSHLKNSR